MGKFIGLVAFLLTVTPLVAEPLSWKMAFLKTQEGKTESIPYTRPLKLQNGDEFQLYISPEKSCWVMVLYEDTSGDLQPLFNAKAAAGQEILLPGKGQKFKVSPPKGSEKLHVLVSLDQPTALVKKLADLPLNSSEVLDDLADLKAAQAKLAEAAEKPVPMGGVLRSTKDDLEATKPTQFTGQEKYVRTIRFDH